MKKDEKKSSGMNDNLEHLIEETLAAALADPEVREELIKEGAEDALKVNEVRVDDSNLMNEFVETEGECCDSEGGGCGDSEEDDCCSDESEKGGCGDGEGDECCSDESEKSGCEDGDDCCGVEEKGADDDFFLEKGQIVNKELDAARLKNLMEKRREDKCCGGIVKKVTGKCCKGDAGCGSCGCETKSGGGKKIGDMNKKEMLDIINTVIDPEVGVGIVDMGLIYDVENREGNVDVVMTLTSMGCPVGPQLMSEVEEVLKTIGGAKSVKVELTFEPAWNLDMMNAEVREMVFGNSA